MKIPRKITFRSVKTPFEQNILAMGLTRLLSLPGVPKTLLPFNFLTSLSFWLSKKHTENCRGTDKAVSSCIGSSFSRDIFLHGTVTPLTLCSLSV